MKKILIIFILLLILAGGAGLFSVYKHRQELRLARLAKQQEKAPETSITFLEGWTNQEIANYLEKQGILKAPDFLIALNNYDTSNLPILNSKPKTADLQGFIFPDTYFIPQTVPSTTSISNVIIKRALSNFTAKFTPQMEQQASVNGMSVYKIITLASIIEKETGRTAITPEQKLSLNTERGIVAGIFYNRLNSGIPLESDATINYITKKNMPAPQLADTQIDSPYNTYKYAGLPPGPICNPSLSSIMAALNPTKTDYVYFLHNQTTGQIYYAKTYAEHLQNKQKYLK